MNELFTAQREKAEKSSRRRWSYISLALLVATILLWVMPKERTIRLAMVVNPDNQTEMQIAIPTHCRITAVYLRGTPAVPESGKLFTLEINDVKIPLENWGKLEKSKLEAEVGTENRIFEAAFPPSGPNQKWLLFASDVNPALSGGALEVVIELNGPEDTVKEWNKIVTLTARNARQNDSAIAPAQQ